MVPGYGPVSLPPVCLPYSPEFRPDQNERGLADLGEAEPLDGWQGTARAGEHLEDMPRQPRLIPLARWLLAAALVLLLAGSAGTPDGPAAPPRWLTWRRKTADVGERTEKRAPVPQRGQPAARATEVSEPAAPATPGEEKTPAVSPAATEQAGVVEAMRLARQQMRRRSE